jgi:hypothetical protein
MTTEIGRKTVVGIGKESSFGSKASSIVYFPAESFNPNPRTENIREEGMFGRKENKLKGVCVAKKWSEPSFEGIAYDDMIGQLLMAAFGTDTKTGSDPYTHTFSMNQGDIPSYTIVYKDGNVTKMMTGCVLSNLEINQETGDFLRYNVSFVGKYPATTTESPSITAENKFCSKFASVKIEDDTASLSGGTAIGAESFRLTIDKGAESLYKFGSNEPSENYDKAIDIAGEFMLNMDAGTYLDLNAAGTEKSLQFETINTDAAGNPTVRFVLNAIDISEWTRDGGKDDRVKQTCGFVGGYDLSDSEAIEGVLINDNATAY